MFSKDRKLGRKGGTRPHPQQTPSCASRTPIPNEVLTGHQKSSGSPQTIPQKPHSFHKAKMHTTPSRPFHHTAHTSAHLISCVGGATTPPHDHTHFTPSLPFSWPHGQHNHTGVVYFINGHGLTFDLLPRPPRQLTGVKGQEGRGTRPPVITSPSRAPQVKHGPTMPRPTGRKKTCINAHTHCTQVLGHAHKLN